MKSSFSTLKFKKFPESLKWIFILRSPPKNHFCRIWRENALKLAIVYCHAHLLKSRSFAKVFLTTIIQ
jgi:hypothetical protein